MVFRVLGDLSARGYAWRTEGRRYVLGRKLLDLAVPRVGDKNLVDEAAPEIRALRDACGEGVGLLVPSGAEAERRRRLDLQVLKRFSARTITDRRALEAHLRRARQRGYAVDHAEELEGVHCVAAPVYDPDGRLTAAVVVTGPSERVPVSRFDELGRRTAAAAGRITERLRR